MTELFLIVLIKYLATALVLAASLIYYRKTGPLKKVTLPILLTAAMFVLMEKVVAPAMFGYVAERSRSIQLM